ncbi:MAG: SAF domain-containing protein [Propioniciclava sp.]
MQKTPLRRRLRRFTYLRRRTLAAVATGLAVLAGLQALAPQVPETVSVVALTRDLPGGTTLTAADVTTVDLPETAVPDGAVGQVDAAVGRTLNGPVSARTPVTEMAIAEGQSLAAPGYVVITLPLSDDTLAPLVQPGIELDLIDPTDGSVLATKVRVVAVPESSSGGILTTASRAALVEVVPDVATRLAVAAQSGGVAIALR